jgi:predicted kinase
MPMAHVALVAGAPRASASPTARVGVAAGAVVLRTGEIRKRRHGVPPETRLPPSAYSAACTAATMAVHIADVRRTLQGGHAVIADATFLDPRDRGTVTMLGLAQGVRFIGLSLDALLAVLRGRVRARAHDASDADAGVLDAASRKPKGHVSWRVIDATTTDAALDEVEYVLRRIGMLAAARVGAGRIDANPPIANAEPRTDVTRHLAV